VRRAVVVGNPSTVPTFGALVVSTVLKCSITRRRCAGICERRGTFANQSRAEGYERELLDAFDAKNESYGQLRASDAVNAVDHFGRNACKS